ncbi:MAG: acyl carrier protein [Lachnospiraceae bacterium]|nr:acyl carrier protein [Lachnospiraceae bacterium]
MTNILEELEESVAQFGTAPILSEMPRRPLIQKGIGGPTAAHVIEEIHTPLNLAATTYTTGSTAFQTPVGITHEELPGRMEATRRVLERVGLRPGNRLLVSYAPLVNVFWGEGLAQEGIEWFFPLRSDRDALIAALCREKPAAVVGESSFLRAVLAQCRKLGLAAEVPEGLILLVAGSPLDPELPETAAQFPGMQVHDLYGCQEFGWLALDGVPLRDDVRLIPCCREGFAQVSCGGLAVGDMLPVSEKGHILNPEGELLTYGRQRVPEEWETVIFSTCMNDAETVRRAARSILRLKSRMVRVSDCLETGAADTCIGLCSWRDRSHIVTLNGPEATEYLDTMIESQLQYQREKKTDPAWLKER